MPVSMIHLSIAKKIDPNSSIGFFVGCLAPDGTIKEELKDLAHLYIVPDREYNITERVINDDALKEFALTVDNDYTKGILLHIYADLMFPAFWIENTTMSVQDKDYMTKCKQESKIINSYAYHNSEWAKSLFNEMENWDYNDFIETEYIMKEDVKWYIPYAHERTAMNKPTESLIFPQGLYDRFVNETVAGFDEWLINLKT
jgi:hypothetical protein